MEIPLAPPRRWPKTEEGGVVRRLPTGEGRIRRNPLTAWFCLNALAGYGLCLAGGAAMEAGLSAAGYWPLVVGLTLLVGGSCLIGFGWAAVEMWRE